MPDAPFLAGVADIGNALGIDILSPLASDWSIHDAVTGRAVIVPDTVTKFEFRGERRISDYPVEQGAFASYNKTVDPYEIRMTMVCSGLNYAQSAISALGLNLGQDYMQKADFIKQLDKMLDATDLFTVVTPDKAYENANLEHYDYRRESTNGATMLIVEAWFREVRVTASAAYTNSNSPSATDPVSAGGVKTFAYGSNPAAALQGVL